MMDTNSLLYNIASLFAQHNIIIVEVHLLSHHRFEFGPQSSNLDYMHDTHVLLLHIATANPQGH